MRGWLFGVDVHEPRLVVGTFDRVTLRFALQLEGAAWRVVELPEPEATDARFVLDSLGRLHLVEKTAGGLFHRVACDLR